MLANQTVGISRVTPPTRDGEGGAGREREDWCFHRLLLSAIISPLHHRRTRCPPLFNPRAANRNGSRNGAARPMSPITPREFVRGRYFALFPADHVCASCSLMLDSQCRERGSACDITFGLKEIVRRETRKERASFHVTRTIENLFCDP